MMLFHVIAGQSYFDLVICLSRMIIMSCSYCPIVEYYPCVVTICEIMLCSYHPIVKYYPCVVTICEIMSCSYRPIVEYYSCVMTICERESIGHGSYPLMIILR